MAITPTERKAKVSTGRRPAGTMGSVLKAFQVLEAFGRHGRPLGVGELSRETGQPKSSLHRTLTTLVHAGVVEQTDGGQYCLTLKLWRLGLPAFTDMDLMQIAQPHLEAARRAVDETVHLAVLEPGGGVVYLTKVESSRNIRVQTRIGTINPSWCTSTGRALLAFLPDMRDRVLAGPMEKRTPLTETDEARLRQILERVAEEGVSIVKGENQPDLGGVSAPIRDHTGTVVAAVGLGIPVFRMDDDLVKRCVPLMIATAASISRDMDYRPVAEGK